MMQADIDIVREMAIIKVNTIEILKSLLELELEGELIDLHNNYDCVKLSFENNSLSLVFKEIEKGNFITVSFSNVTIVKFDLFNFSESKGLTLDNLYRGRFEKEGNLHEMDENNRGYLYIDFYESQKVEFFCERFNVEKGAVFNIDD